MGDVLIAKIKDFILSESIPLPFPVATEDAVREAEKALGFALPALLRDCYLEVGNGGFGPGLGLVGLKGGYESDPGDLVALHGVTIAERKKSKSKWPPTLLQFCDWGCTMYACVDCKDPGSPISLSFGDIIERQDYTLDKFFELWMEGVNLMAYKATFKRITMRNPFNGQPMTIKQRNWRRSR